MQTSCFPPSYCDYRRLSQLLIQKCNEMEVPCDPLHLQKRSLSDQMTSRLVSKISEVTGEDSLSQQWNLPVNPYSNSTVISLNSAGLKLTPWLTFDWKCLWRQLSHPVIPVSRLSASSVRQWSHNNHLQQLSVLGGAKGEQGWGGLDCPWHNHHFSSPISSLREHWHVLTDVLKFALVVIKTASLVVLHVAPIF